MAADRALRLRGVLLPDGDAPTDIWIDGGALTGQARTGAEDLSHLGGFLLAGLVDAHTHLTMDTSGTGHPVGSAALVEANLDIHRRAGELCLRDAGGVTLAAHAYRGRGEYPALQAAAGFLAPEGGYMAAGDWTDSEDLPAAARRHAGGGADWVKVIADWPTRGGIRLNYDVATLTAFVEAARGAGARTIAHIAGAEGAHTAVKAGIESIEHGDGMDESDLLALAARGGAWTPTIAMYPPMIRAAVSRPESAERLISARDEWLRWAVPRASGLGITILAGTDTLPKGEVWREVAALEAYGLDPVSSLAAASKAARAYLGEPEDWSEGSPASVVVYASDPRRDPEVLARPAAVILRGRVTAP